MIRKSNPFLLDQNFSQKLLEKLTKMCQKCQKLKNEEGQCFIIHEGIVLKFLAIYLPLKILLESNVKLVFTLEDFVFKSLCP